MKNSVCRIGHGPAAQRGVGMARGKWVRQSTTRGVETSKLNLAEAVGLMAELRNCRLFSWAHDGTEDDADPEH